MLASGQTGSPHPTADLGATNPSGLPTLQRVLDETQLADDVSGNIGLYSLANFGVSFCSFQEVVKLLRVKLLDGENQAQLRSETLQS